MDTVSISFWKKSYSFAKIISIILFVSSFFIACLIFLDAYSRTDVDAYLGVLISVAVIQFFIWAPAMIGKFFGNNAFAKIGIYLLSLIGVVLAMFYVYDAMTCTGKLCDLVILLAPPLYWFTFLGFSSFYFNTQKMALLKICGIIVLIAVSAPALILMQSTFSHFVFGHRWLF